MVDLASLFQKMADAFEGTVEAEELRPLYARLTLRGFEADGRVSSTTCELFPYEATDGAGARIPLVRIQTAGDRQPVIVSPVASAVIAVCCR